MKMEITFFGRTLVYLIRAIVKVDNSGKNGDFD